MKQAENDQSLCDPNEVELTLKRYSFRNSTN